MSHVHATPSTRAMDDGADPERWIELTHLHYAYPDGH
jgi:hypothetical protein